jgi:hypothetical protein
LLLLFQVMGQLIILILFLKKKYKCFSTKKAGSYYQNNQLPHNLK